MPFYIYKYLHLRSQTTTTTLERCRVSEHWMGGRARGIKSFALHCVLHWVGRFFFSRYHSPSLVYNPYFGMAWHGMVLHGLHI